MDLLPKISVVTVVFNDELNIKKTILSVLNQDYKNVEYIIIDGRSNDNTVNIIKEYENYIYKWISEEDNGIYDAMNKGIDFSTGEFIIFMNSGDIFFNDNVLSNIFQRDEISEKDIIFGNTCVDFNSYNRLIKGTYPQRNNPMTFNHQSVFVRNSLLKHIKFDTSYKICADKNLFFYLFKMKSNYYYIPETIAKINAFGFSNSNRVKTLKEVKDIYKKHNISNTAKINTDIMKAYILTFIESILGKDKVNKLRFYLKR